MILEFFTVLCIHMMLINHCTSTVVAHYHLMAKYCQKDGSILRFYPMSKARNLQQVTKKVWLRTLGVHWESLSSCHTSGQCQQIIIVEPAWCHITMAKHCCLKVCLMFWLVWDLSRQAESWLQNLNSGCRSKMDGPINMLRVFITLLCTHKLTLFHNIDVKRWLSTTWWPNTNADLRQETSNKWLWKHNQWT